MKHLRNKIMVIVFICLVIFGIAILTYKTMITTILGICCLVCAAAIMYILLKEYDEDHKDD